MEAWRASRRADFANNTYYSARPTGTKVFVRPNKYEPGRANITIYNWDKAATVTSTSATRSRREPGSYCAACRTSSERPR